jgi:hypothetical protein
MSLVGPSAHAAIRSTKPRGGRRTGLVVPRKIAEPSCEPQLPVAVVSDDYCRDWLSNGRVVLGSTDRPVPDERDIHMPVLVGVLNVHPDAEGVMAYDGPSDKGALSELSRRIDPRHLVGVHVPLGGHVATLRLKRTLMPHGGRVDART